MAYGIGVIGAGTVGGGVVEILLSNAGVISDKAGVELALQHVAELREDLLKDLGLNDVTASKDAHALIADPAVNIVCELIGGIEPAKSFILEALNAGKHVVTANKMLLAKHGRELCEAAVKNNVELRYEAAVAGTIPIIKTLRESLASNHIHAVYGILNGTCNYILTQMSVEGLEFDVALKQAQMKGFAETPPDLDIEGHDTAHKCQILASLCHSTYVPLDEIFVEGITKITHLDVQYAQELGYRIKLLAIIRRVEGEVEARVHPTLVSEQHPLANVRNEFNAIYVESDMAGATLYYGRGAGKYPTASAVVSDLVDIAQRGNGPVPPPFRYSHSIATRDIGLLDGRYYLRFTTEDHPGVLGRICTVLGKHGVSIASLFQKEEDEHTDAHVVLMTHETVESSLMAAKAEIDALECIIEPTHVLRVL
ncbi:MAG TPA: homoserine dehydrogenase [Candidatus Hydrogenedentes bacterium]|nr:homoserine dehydrogenase [Candidatus Hydrogenedentota bacterium]